MTDLSPKQRKAIEILAQGDQRSYGDIAKELNVTQNTLYRWRKQDAFAKAVRDRAYELLREQLPEIYSVLNSISKEGNTKAIQIFLDHLERMENDVAKADGQITFTWKRREIGDDDD